MFLFYFRLILLYPKVVIWPPPYFGTPATPLAMTELYKITLRSLQIIITIANAFDNTVILVYKIHLWCVVSFWVIRITRVSTAINRSPMCRPLVSLFIAESFHFAMLRNPSRDCIRPVEVDVDAKRTLSDFLPVSANRPVFARFILRPISFIPLYLATQSSDWQSIVNSSNFLSFYRSYTADGRYYRRRHIESLL